MCLELLSWRFQPPMTERHVGEPVGTAKEGLEGGTFVEEADLWEAHARTIRH